MTDDNDDDDLDDDDHLNAQLLRDALDHVERAAGDHFPRHFNRQGQAITFGEWGLLFEDKSYQVLAQSWTLNGSWVSTVWLGLNHNWRGGPPIIFETMVWHDGGDTTQERYATEAQAFAGHEAIVQQFGGHDVDRQDERAHFPPMQWPDDDVEE